MSEQQVRATINQKLIESGEKERLKDMLRSKLVECGWRDEMKVHCKEIIKQKGVENVHVEDLVEEVIPKGRASVPPEVKAELLQCIRKFLANVNVNN
ncbi:Transcription and mRNA export factor eny2 [Balamuthia mandrillaris]